MTPREFAHHVVQRLRQKGYEALWAGGCVRDFLLALEPHDYDVATNATPSEVQKVFRRTVAVGAQFGVIEVLGPESHLQVQVATFRSDGAYTDGRHPDAVTFGNAEADALRRDFTINGMFFDPLENKVIDYVGGQVDLQAKVLRAIGGPVERFTEDKLRLLRAVRFAARFQMRMDAATEAALVAMAPQITVVSAERITEEMRKMLSHAYRQAAMLLVHRLGLLRAILPEMYSEQVTFVALSHLPADAGFPLALTLFLLELAQAKGEEAPKRLQQRKWRHGFAEKWRLSNQELEEMSWLLDHHTDLREAPTLPWCKLKPLLAHTGIDDLLALHKAQALASGESLAAVQFCEERLQTWTEEDLNPLPLVSGEDLKEAGLPPGPKFKEILQQLRDAQLNGELLGRAQALVRLRTLVEQALRSGLSGKQG
jgi:poly(A) polymerase